MLFFFHAFIFGGSAAWGFSLYIRRPPLRGAWACRILVKFCLTLSDSLQFRGFRLIPPILPRGVRCFSRGPILFLIFSFFFVLCIPRKSSKKRLPQKTSKRYSKSTCFAPLAAQNRSLMIWASILTSFWLSVSIQFSIFSESRRNRDSIGKPMKNQWFSILAASHFCLDFGPIFHTLSECRPKPIISRPWIARGHQKTVYWFLGTFLGARPVFEVSQNLPRLAKGRSKGTKKAAVPQTRFSFYALPWTRYYSTFVLGHRFCRFGDARGSKNIDFCMFIWYILLIFFILF